MEPKFQSSFIPKGPLATTGTATKISRDAGHSILGTLAVFVFTFAILLTLGVFGYEFYLKANISKMTDNLASAKASLEPETIQKISDLDGRIISTKDLLDNHIVLSPLFDYLEISTLKNVRFTQFQYQTTEKGLEVNMRGQARGYSAVALQSEIFNKSPYFRNPIFADLDLDERGNVTFSFKANLDPSILSYKKGVANMRPVEAQVINAVAPASTSTATSTATTTPR
jgi:hypothetical protein